MATRDIDQGEELLIDYERGQKDLDYKKGQKDQE